MRHLVREGDDAQRLALEWLRRSRKARGTRGLDDGLLMEYWWNARPIIARFNELGGGPEEDEEEVMDWLGRIVELVRKGRVSTEGKLAFLDEAFEEYDAGNSGFEDALMETFFDVCRTREEWEYLIDKLGAHPSRWRTGRIMRILRDHLHEDGRYLELRTKALEYGSDYWDLARFHLDRGDRDKVVEVAELGALKGQGRCEELFVFLFSHYEELGDEAALARVVRMAVERGSDEKGMLGRFFEHHRACGDYEEARDALLAGWAFVGRGHYKEYQRLKAFLREEDWMRAEPQLFAEMRERDLKGWLRACLDKGMKKEVLEAVLDPPRDRFGRIVESDLDGFADVVGDEFPEKVIEHSWRRACDRIMLKNRESYREAARHLRRVKHLYVDVLGDGATWRRRFSALKEEHERRRAFLDEVRDL